MSNFEKAVDIFSRSVRAYAEIEQMKAANKMAELRGDSLVYYESDFSYIAEKFNICPDDIQEMYEDKR